jgi:Family of unknown function (DUF6599)
MQCRKKASIIITILLLLVAPFVIKAQQAPSSETSSPALPVTDAATLRSLAELLPDKLAGLKATSDTKQYAGDNLAELVADKQGAYQEYLVTRAVSRRYAEARVDIFETANTFAAFGLFTYNFGPAGGKAVLEEIGSGGARVGGDLIFWKENYFVRVVNADQRLMRAQGAAHASLARAVAGKLNPDSTESARPSLLESLPAGSSVARSERYFLGPESLNAYLERGREMFGFAGDAEAVMAEYQEAGAANAQPGDAATTGGASIPATPRGGPVSPGRDSASESPRPPLKLVIVEYHTPQFAYDAMARVNDYIATLPEDEQNRIIVKREGNYIVEAVNVDDRDFAQALVEAVKYPYGVKWLRDPRLPSNDPFRIQKAAQMLLSTFTLLGLLLLAVLVGGGIVGTAIFLKRRKLQQGVFSNAGGMLRLDIDPFEATLLGLPPKRSNED